MSQQGFIKGRGTAMRPNARFESTHTEAQDDGWIGDLDEIPQIARTHVTEERARSIISRNTSPDVPIDASLNPYRGCEHVIRTA